MAISFPQYDPDFLTGSELLEDNGYTRGGILEGPHSDWGRRPLCSAGRATLLVMSHEGNDGTRHSGDLFSCPTCQIVHLAAIPGLHIGKLEECWVCAWCSVNIVVRCPCCSEWINSGSRFIFMEGGLLCCWDCWWWSVTVKEPWLKGVFE